MSVCNCVYMCVEVHSEDPAYSSMGDNMGGVLLSQIGFI